MSKAISANVDRFTGFTGYAECYDAHRPKPPVAIVDLLTQVAGIARPKLVIDVGSGTGLSTRVWSGRADRVIGIEPNPHMRQAAERIGGGVAYLDATSAHTTLPDACADVVTCSQSLHWLEPRATFAEVARVLRPDGAFAAYDCDWPPAMNWRAEAAYNAFMEHVQRLEETHGIAETIRRWPKHEHLSRMRESRVFRFTREVVLHHTEPGDGGRLIELARSQGSVGTLLARGLSEADLHLPHLRAAAQEHLPHAVPWYFSYRLRVGVK
jgi:ubiquinone/menaquinone biosynthesis C-methylase UbiE